MNNYRKGKNVEEPLERSQIPIPNLPHNFLWMQVRGGSKIRNLLSHALNEFPEAKHVIWTGFGTSVGKAITCAEIMKRELGNALHQITKICYRLIEEYWDPNEAELVPIVVKRKLPMIHIYLSSESLNESEIGYQAPGTTVPFKSNNSQNSENERKNHNQNRKTRGAKNGFFNRIPNERKSKKQGESSKNSNHNNNKTERS